MSMFKWDLVDPAPGELGADRILGEPRPDGMGDFEGRRAGGNRALGAVGESQYDGHGILCRLPAAMPGGCRGPGRRSRTRTGDLYRVKVAL